MLERQICSWGSDMVLSFCIKPPFTLGITHQSQHIQNPFPSRKKDKRFSLRDLFYLVVFPLLGDSGQPNRPICRSTSELSWILQTPENWRLPYCFVIFFSVSSCTGIGYCSVVSFLQAAPLTWWSRPFCPKDLTWSWTSITFSLDFFDQYLLFLICVLSCKSYHPCGSLYSKKTVIPVYF